MPELAAYLFGKCLCANVSTTYLEISIYEVPSVPTAVGSSTYFGMNLIFDVDCFSDFDALYLLRVVPLIYI